MFPKFLGKLTTVLSCTVALNGCVPVYTTGSTSPFAVLPTRARLNSAGFLTIAIPIVVEKKRDGTPRSRVEVRTNVFITNEGDVTGFTSGPWVKW